MEILGIGVVEWVGYFASAMVLISFLMKRIKYLRIINTAGCALFVVYGLILAPVSWPIVATNVAIIIINLYYLINTKSQNAVEE